MNWGEVRMKLPLPPSDNATHLPVISGGKATLVNSTEYRVFKEGALAYAKALAKRYDLAPLTGPVCIKLTCFFPTLSSDCTNRMKAMSDALKPIVWNDDRQVAYAEERKEFCAPGEDPYCVVEVMAYEHPEMAKRLAAAMKRKAPKPPPPPIARTSTVDRPRLTLVRDLKHLATSASYPRTK